MVVIFLLFSGCKTTSKTSLAVIENNNVAENKKEIEEKEPKVNTVSNKYNEGNQDSKIRETTKTGTNVFGTSPLGYINNNNVPGVIKAIGEGLNVNARYKDGKTALMVAAGNNAIEVAELLIKNGADVNAVDKNRRTALMEVADWTSLDEIRILLSKGMDVNPWNRYGETTLVRDSLALVWLLIKHGANINAEDNWGWTALMIAQQKSNKEIITLLEKQGVK